MARSRSTKSPSPSPRQSGRPDREPVPCRRLDATRTVAEHLECPYCFGRADDVQPAQWERFCDFDAQVDPICFGFPSTHGRLSRG